MILFELTDSERFLQQCEASRVALANYCLQTLLQEFNRFWSDPVKNSENLVNKAATAFEYHSLLGQFIATVAPEMIPQLPSVASTGYSVQWNPDGSMVVNKLDEE